MGKKEDIPSIGETIFGKPFKRRPLKRGRSPFDFTPIDQRPKQPKRDSRRAFGQNQKKQILYQQDNKCAKCHEKLDPRTIHFHHIKPWASGGRTITQNGAALCPKCHEILSHQERLKQTDKKRKSRRESPFSIL
jgi:5-methylcytosine-specific restriction endonuclease McrA